MKQKDLAEEYAIKEYVRPNGNRNPVSNLFTFDDIKAAFNAGRESVVENLPKLKWENVFEDGAYIAASSFGLSYKVEFAYNKFNLFCNSIYINCYGSLSETKQAAKEHYKELIKQALGL